MLLPYISHQHTLLYLFQVSARSVNHTVQTYRPCIQQLYNTTVVLEVNQVLPAEKKREPAQVEHVPCRSFIVAIGLLIVSTLPKVN